MSPQSTFATTERAEQLFDTKAAALNSMKTELVSLAAEALHALLRNGQRPYSGVIIRAVPDLAEIPQDLPTPLRAWQIGGTGYHLPEWRTTDGILAGTLEQTFAKPQTVGPPEIVGFGEFVKRCSRGTYISVCEGLERLARTA